MKISLLIPVYDYDIVALVHSMKNAIGKVPEFCEILIGDDGSSVEYREKYQLLADDNVKVIDQRVRECGVPDGFSIGKLYASEGGRFAER